MKNYSLSGKTKFFQASKNAYTHILKEDQEIIEVMGESEEQAQERADFIVRACNCHAELVEALTELLKGVEAHERRTGVVQWAPSIKQAREALNNAKL